MLYCVRGQIVFRAAGGGIELGPGDNMVPGALHGSWQIRAGLDSKGIMTGDDDRAGGAVLAWRKRGWGESAGLLPSL